MYIPHAADSEQTICGSKMSRFEDGRLRSKVFVTRWEFEGRKLDELLSFGVSRFEYHH